MIRGHNRSRRQILRLAHRFYGLHSVSLIFAAQPAPIPAPGQRPSLRWAARTSLEHEHRVEGRATEMHSSGIGSVGRSPPECGTLRAGCSPGSGGLRDPGRLSSGTATSASCRLCPGQRGHQSPAGERSRKLRGSTPGGRPRQSHTPAPLLRQGNRPGEIQKSRSRPHYSLSLLPTFAICCPDLTPNKETDEHLLDGDRTRDRLAARLWEGPRRDPAQSKCLAGEARVSTTFTRLLH